MKKTIKKYLSEKFVSRWAVLGIDVSLVLGAWAMAYFLRFNVKMDLLTYKDMFRTLPLVMFAYTLGFLVFQSYIGVVRHTSVRDAYRLFLGCSGAVLIVVLASLVGRNIESLRFFSIPHSVTLIHYFISLFALIFSRLLIKAVISTLTTTETGNRSKSILIYGAGSSGLITKASIEKDGSDYEVVGFIDDNQSLKGKMIDNVPVFTKKQVFKNDILKKKKIKEIIFSIQNIAPVVKNQILDEFIQLDVKVKNVPPVEQWINGQLSVKQLRKVQIDDLLGRSAIVLDDKSVKKELTNKVVLVTGAAGSIGSEICRQVLSHHPKKLILLDQAESPLYELEQGLLRSNKSNASRIVSVIGSVCNAVQLERVFQTHQPDLIYHAAAYKHVPLMEEYPLEAVRVNILGTRNVAQLAVKYQADKFVMVSTDKAVNPTNVMGASKRVAEIFCQSRNEVEGNTKFIATRFGNVLGSNGSVIPLFKKQIKNGGPITVTHPEITRYFMTIPEACSLVLEAGTMGKGGEVYIFDMGKSIKIYDLAKTMIKLSGLELGKDIQIEFSGLRPGEKLYEELLNKKENTIETHHPKIMVAKVLAYNASEVDEYMEELNASLNNCNNEDLVRKLKKIVPEYISKNSVFEVLDN